MARTAIVMYSLYTDRGSGYSAGGIVITYWNDSTSQLEVDYFDSISDPTPSTKTSGPSLGISGVDHFAQFYGPNAFCNGTTYTYFGYSSSTFPYAVKQEVLNSQYCSLGPVCDLQISDNPVIVKSSNSSFNDGSVIVSATSSNGTIKYGLTDFNYLTEGQTSGTFDDLFAGTYTIYAKDSQGCSDTITVTIPVETTYGLKYVSEWRDIHGKNNNGFYHKVEILSLGYVGSTIELKAAGEPLSYKLNSDGEDKFYAIRAKQLTFRFAAEETIDTSDLFSEDDRQFQVKHYIDYGSGYELDFMGYQIPFLYTEQYAAKPYYAEISATDGLANLKDLDFVDESGNNFRTTQSALSIIKGILKKLDLTINIRSAINMFEDSMDNSSSDDPLTQAYYDTTIYYDADGTPKKCDEVIKNILLEYSACIAQADGKWIIWRPEELTGEFAYREFSPSGVYQSNGTIDPDIIINIPNSINRLAWKGRSASLSMLSSYGKFIVTQKLTPKASLLPSYSFDATDLVYFGNGDYFFAGWGISISSGTNFSWGQRDIVRDDNVTGVCFIDMGYHDTNGYHLSDELPKEIQLFTSNAPIEFKSGDKIRFSFDYFLDLSVTFAWYNLQFKLQIGSYYFYANDPSGNVWGTVDPGYQSIYTSEFNKWQTFSKVVDTPTIFLSDNEIVDATISLSLKISNGDVAQTYTTSNLKSETTTGSTSVSKRIAYASLGSTTIRGFYELESGTEAESLPDVVRPNDFNSSTNPKVWRLKYSDNGLVNIREIMFDNMIIEYLPNGVKSPKSQQSIVTYNTNNKRTLEVEINHGDVPLGIINAKNTYKNCIRYYDGVSYTPTSAWTRNGISESDTIQKILLKTLVAQFRKTSRRLPGSLIGDKYIKPYSVLIEQNDSNRRYLCQGYEQSGRLNEYNIDLYELKNINGDDPVQQFSGAFAPAQFGVSFD